MNTKIFSLFSLLILSSVSLADEDADTELLALGKEAFRQRLLVKAEEDRVIAFRRVLENHSDEDKIEAIALVLFSTDDDERHYMRSSNAMIPGYALGQDRDLIQDWSKLRSMIREERDPRRFYLLTCIRPWPKNGYVYDFIPEMSHMLFASGRVAKEEGEYTQPYAHDVSLYTYKAITGTLKLLNAEYEPLENLGWERAAHNERISHLANWLIQNWPGCENLQIPEQITEQSRPDSPGIQQERVQRRTNTQDQAHELDTPQSSSRWIWVAGGIMILITFYGFINMKKC